MLMSQTDVVQEPKTCVSACGVDQGTMIILWHPEKAVRESFFCTIVSFGHDIWTTMRARNVEQIEDYNVLHELCDYK